MNFNFNCSFKNYLFSKIFKNLLFKDANFEIYFIYYGLKICFKNEICFELSSNLFFFILQVQNHCVNGSQMVLFSDWEMTSHNTTSNVATESLTAGNVQDDNISTTNFLSVSEELSQSKENGKRPINTSKPSNSNLISK